MEPDELVALIRDTITQTLARSTTTTTTPDLEERTRNAEREYQRLCKTYEELLTEHLLLKQELATLQGETK